MPASLTPRGRAARTPLDFLCAVLLDKEEMLYKEKEGAGGEGQRDMVVMAHKIVAEYPSSSAAARAHGGRTKQTITSTLVGYKTKGETAMARCVVCPVSSRLVLWSSLAGSSLFPSLLSV